MLISSNSTRFPLAQSDFLDLDLNQFDSHVHMDTISKFSRSSSFSTFSIDMICEDLFTQARSIPLGSDKHSPSSKEQENDKLIIGFRDHEKVGGILNVVLYWSSLTPVLIILSQVSYSTMKVPVV